MSRLLLAAAAALWAAASAAAPREDRLISLEENPAPSATEQVARMYRHSEDPYARFWLMDVLYARVKQHRDIGAMEILWEASRDRHPDVRRKAISDLEAFRFLSPSQGRDLWLHRVRDAVQSSSRDPSSAVRSAGRELGLAIGRWQAAEASAAPPASPESPILPARLAVPIFVWIVCFQLLGYGWHRMGLSLLAQAGPPGRAVLKTIAALKKNLPLLAFPVSTAALLFALLGVSLGWRLIAASVPASGPGPAGEVWKSLGFLAAVYLLAGVACFMPAALMTGTLVGGFKKSSLRIFCFMLASAASMMYWPLEAGGRLLRIRWRQGRSYFWMAKTGTPFAALLTCGVMVRGGLPFWTALREAARRFPAASQEPGAEFWGRAPFQTPFVLWCLASPAIFSLSLAPAVQLGFHPSQVFGPWFVPDAQFAVGFGWWAGILLSAAGFGQLMALGAVRASELVRESFAADGTPDARRREK